MYATGHTITKKAPLKSVKALPDQVSVEDLVDRVLLLSKIERGMEQLAKGEVCTTGKARKRLRKWSK